MFCIEVFGDSLVVFELLDRLERTAAKQQIVGRWQNLTHAGDVNPSRTPADGSNWYGLFDRAVAGWGGKNRHGLQSQLLPRRYPPAAQGALFGV